jgi:hypothetical protein
VASWTDLERGRYEILLVREMSVATSNRLLGLGVPPSAGQVWVVIVRGPYRSFEQLDREPLGCGCSADSFVDRGHRMLLSSSKQPWGTVEARCTCGRWQTYAPGRVNARAMWTEHKIAAFEAEQQERGSSEPVTPAPTNDGDVTDDQEPR